MLSTIAFADVVLDENITEVQPKYTPKVVKQKDNLTIKDEETVKQLVELQQQKDLQDIETLWDSTVDNNNLIKFTLKKMASPDSQKRVHSSLMAKTLSALIGGAAFIPSVFGADSMLQSASFASSRIASNLINKPSTPLPSTLTDTELIELAGLIEELQNEIISTYYNYKATLNQIKEIRTKLYLYNKNYHNALVENDDMEILVSSSMYDETQIQEIEQINLAKKYYLKLERLAGKKAIQKLNLQQYAIKNELFDPQVMTEGIKNEN